MTSTTAKTTAPSSRARAWLTPLLAWCFEIGYALCIRGSQGFTVLSWSLVAVVFFLLPLFGLSISLRTIDARHRLRRLGRASAQPESRSSDHCSSTSPTPQQRLLAPS